MIPRVTVDLSGLNGRLLELQDALVGAGQPGDLHGIIHTEGRLLAWECATVVGPRKKEDAEAAIYRDAKKTYAPGPVEVFAVSKRKGRGGDSGLTWLYAGPDFLVGVPDENLQPGLSAAAMRKDLSRYQQQAEKNAWQPIGRRGRQSIQKWNRVVVKRAEFASYIKTKQSRVGRMRATFAYAAYKLGHTRIGKWISRHFEQLAANGAAIYDETRLRDPHAPTIVFGGSAPGLIKNFEAEVEHAVENRVHKVAAKTQDLIRGYAQDWMAGRKIRKRT